MSQINAHNDHQYRKQFSLINQLLEQSRALWQVKAFEAKTLPWEADFPNLAKALWAIEDDKLDSLDAEQTRLVTALSPALSEDLRALGLDWDLSLLAEPIAQSIGPRAASELGLAPGDEAHF
ncbi:MAG: methyltransferase, partial [Shewanella sp.]